MNGHLLGRQGGKEIQQNKEQMYQDTGAEDSTKEQGTFGELHTV
jgi:hypothetical protein